MADNFKQLKSNLDQAIDPAAAVGAILAQDHNNVFTEFINKSGKYTGAPFLSKKEAINGIVPTGTLVWNNNAFNNTNDFVITVAKKTLDTNDIGRILDTLGEGALIHFKDFVGRSTYLQYKSHLADTDAVDGDVYNIIVTGFADNPNYAYQPNESELCIISFYNLNAPASQSFLSNVQIKYFNLYNGSTWQEQWPGMFYEVGTNNSFTLSNNEIGVFFSKGQNNDADVYDYEQIHFFTKGSGTWGSAATPVTADDFILISKSQFATNLPTGIDNSLQPDDYLKLNFPVFKATNTSEYLLAMHKSFASRVELMQLLFSWSSHTDDLAVTNRSVYSPRFQGNYFLLSVKFQDFDVLKEKQQSGVKYTLLIDRYRGFEHKGGSATRHRKAGYKHEIIPDLGGYSTDRINEIVIDNSTMILDFKQDHYFQPLGTVNQTNKFPSPTGVQPNKRQVNNYGLTGLIGPIVRRTGFVDLGFRIRCEAFGTGIKFETRYLGFVRMQAVSTNSGDGWNRHISYVMRQH